MTTRKQCAKCPWRKDVDPYDIPNGYLRKKHAALKDTIARPGDPVTGSLKAMACHETDKGQERPCVGWLVHQLGLGNNLSLRLAVMHGQVNADVETVGKQHERFEDTLPKKRRSSRKRV